MFCQPVHGCIPTPWVYFQISKITIPELIVLSRGGQPPGSPVSKFLSVRPRHSRSTTLQSNQVQLACADRLRRVGLVNRVSDSCSRLKIPLQQITARLNSWVAYFKESGRFRVSLFSLPVRVVTVLVKVTVHWIDSSPDSTRSDRRCVSRYRFISWDVARAGRLYRSGAIFGLSG